MSPELACVHTPFVGWYSGFTSIPAGQVDVVVAPPMGFWSPEKQFPGLWAMVARPMSPLVGLPKKPLFWNWLSRLRLPVAPQQQTPTGAGTQVPPLQLAGPDSW